MKWSSQVSKWLLPAIAAAVTLAAATTMAEISPTGDVSPADPAAWTDGPALTQLRRQLQTPGTVLVADEDPAALSVSLAEGCTREIVAVAQRDGVPFTSAVRVRIAKAFLPVYQVQAFSSKTTAPIQKGDTLLISCWLRAPDVVGQNAGVAALKLQMDVEPWTSPAGTNTTCDGSWKQVFAAGVASQNFAAGSLQIAFHLGQQKQVLELGSVVVLNLGPGVDLGKLPWTRLTWPGMEPDAPWRKRAQRRIEQFRMADLALQVLDAQGQPVPDAKVRIQQQQRAFSIGSFANPTVLLAPTPDGDKTRGIFLRLFNRATCPIYWADWGWPGRKKDYLAAGQWFHDRGYAVRGHVMIYPNFSYLPKDLLQLKNDPKKLQARLLQQIREVGEATQPLEFREYDVTNELRDCQDLYTILGKNAVAEWYAAARQVVPRAKLALNENTILTDAGATQANQDLYLEWYRFLKSKGQAPDVLGFQGHFGEAFTGPETLWAILDRFAKETAAELQITEFDINTRNEAAQADYTRDFLTACFAHPRITAITMWGFWEGDHWLPVAAAYRKDWSAKPNGRVLEELLTKTWWTDTTVITGPDGRGEAKVFLGSHNLSVSVGGKDISRHVQLEQAGRTVIATLRP